MMVLLFSEFKFEWGKTQCTNKKQRIKTVWCNWAGIGKLCWPLFADKVLWEQSHMHLFTYYLWLLSCCNTSQLVVTENIWPAKPKIFAIWSFTEKKEFADSCSSVRLGGHFWLNNWKTAVILRFIINTYLVFALSWQTAPQSLGIS